MSHKRLEWYYILKDKFECKEIPVEDAIAQVEARLPSVTQDRVFVIVLFACSFYKLH